MFMGELSCLLAFNILYFYRKKKDVPMELGDQTFNRLIFLPAAMLDMCGTSLMYVGLNLTFASSFQMLRGMMGEGNIDSIFFSNTTSGIFMFLSTTIT